MTSRPPPDFAPPTLNIGGVTPLTTIDYPGELAAVVFCQGCPWRCRYCHNGHLLGKDTSPTLDWQAVLALLRRRRGLLDAVVFSGGEPTLQRDLPNAIDAVRRMGFKVGLHTAGCYPARLDALLPTVDWIGLDIKALAEDYPALTGVRDSGARALDSLRRVIDCGVAYEVRVTVHDDVLPPPRLQRLLERLDAYGADSVVLQRCRTHGTLDPALGDNHLSWPFPPRCDARIWHGAEGQAANDTAPESDVTHAMRGLRPLR